jgi:hypothetical protein
MNPLNLFNQFERRVPWSVNVQRGIILLLCMLGVFSIAAKPAYGPGEGTIRGAAFVDSNRNGKMDANEKGLAREVLPPSRLRRYHAGRTRGQRARIRASHLRLHGALPHEGSAGSRWGIATKRRGEHPRPEGCAGAIRDRECVLHRFGSSAAAFVTAPTAPRDTDGV